MHCLKESFPFFSSQLSTLNSQLSTPTIAADPVVQYMSRPDIEKSIKNARRRMEEAAKKLDFIEAAQWRDEMLQLEELLKQGVSLLATKYLKK